jgi:hypothetical protein
MKTIKTDSRRKFHFESIISNKINNNNFAAKTAINQLSKIDIIRFINFLKFFNNSMYIDVCGDGTLDIFSNN